MKILIVDDQKDDRDLLRIALSRKGHETVEADDGDRALQIFREQGDFDLVITDNLMRRMNGIDLIRPLKQACESIRIWLVSGSLQSDTIDEALERGAERAVQKQTLDPLLRAAGII